MFSTTTTHLHTFSNQHIHQLGKISATFWVSAFSPTFWIVLIYHLSSEKTVWQFIYIYGYIQFLPSISISIVPESAYDLLEFSRGYAVLVLDLNLSRPDSFIFVLGRQPPCSKETENRLWNNESLQGERDPAGLSGYSSHLPDPKRKWSPLKFPLALKVRG